MTTAIVSQVVSEVIRRNTSVRAQASQVYIEVILPQTSDAHVSQVFIEVLRANTQAPLGFFLLFED